MNDQSVDRHRLTKHDKHMPSHMRCTAGYETQVILTGSQ